MKIDLLVAVVAGFGKRSLLKKDYQVFVYQLTSRGIDLLAEAGLGKNPILLLGTWPGRQTWLWILFGFTIKPVFSLSLWVCNTKLGNILIFYYLLRFRRCWT